MTGCGGRAPRVGALLAAACAAAMLGACVRRPAVAPAAPPAPMDSGAFLAPERIAALPAARRGEWEAYLARSARLHERDSATMADELRAAGAESMTRAPRGAGFQVEEWMTAEWLATDSARRVAERVLSFQAPNGGWSKRVDMMARSRRPGESWASEGRGWSWISTVDNGATTSQLEFVALADSVQPDARYRASFLRGLRYLLDAQMPNGCWPQVFPLRGGYHDAVTFNDDATVRAAEVLRSAAGGTPAFVPAAERGAAAAAVRRAVDCVLAAQVEIGGRRTVWGQQHDPLTLAPVAARSYEPVSLSSQESARIVRFLMREPQPDPRLVNAVHDAVEWFRRTAIHDVAYTFDGGLREAPGEGPVWARLHEIGTDRPIFSNRDGVILYDWHQLTDRRQGYAWYSYVPLSMLKAYGKWASAHPRPDAG